MALAPNVAWLFVGRVISGIAASSFSTAGAYIADVTPPEKRAAGFGLMGAAFGLGFVLGPAVGGIWARAILAFHFGARRRPVLSMPAMATSCCRNRCRPSAVLRLRGSGPPSARSYCCGHIMNSSASRLSRVSQLSRARGPSKRGRPVFRISVWLGHQGGRPHPCRSRYMRHDRARRARETPHGAIRRTQTVTSRDCRVGQLPLDLWPGAQRRTATVWGIPIHHGVLGTCRPVRAKLDDATRRRI